MEVVAADPADADGNKEEAKDCGDDASDERRGRTRLTIQEIEIAELQIRGKRKGEGDGGKGEEGDEIESAGEREVAGDAGSEGKHDRYAGGEKDESGKVHELFSGGAEGGFTGRGGFRRGR